MAACCWWQAFVTLDQGPEILTSGDSQGQGHMVRFPYPMALGSSLFPLQSPQMLCIEKNHHTGCAGRIYRSQSHLHVLLGVFLIEAMEINTVNTLIMNWPAHIPCFFLRKRNRERHILAPALSHPLPLSGRPSENLPSSYQQHLRFGVVFFFIGCSLSLCL